jgi:hypothetical protein
VKLRRVFTALLALVLFASMLQQPMPALASPPLLDVITLDPLAAGSSGQTGTVPFDATSYNPVGGTNPGTDSSATDHIVRTNDTIAYDFQYSVNSAPGVNITLTSVLGQYLGADVADWTTLPAGCGAGSSISGDGQTLVCDIGAVAQGSAQDVIASAKIRVTAPNGATIQPSITVNDPGTVGTIPVTNTGYWINQSTPSTTTMDTITSVGKYNAMKQSTSAKPVIEPYTYFGDGGVQGYYIDFPVLVREGDGRHALTRPQFDPCVKQRVRNQRQRHHDCQRALRRDRRGRRGDVVQQRRELGIDHVHAERRRGHTGDDHDHRSQHQRLLVPGEQSRQRGDRQPHLCRRGLPAAVGSRYRRQPRRNRQRARLHRYVHGHRSGRTG